MKTPSELIFDRHLIIDQISTWPSEIVNLIESARNDLLNNLKEEARIDNLAIKNVEYRYNRPFNKYKESWCKVVELIENELKETKIIGFHCTRLMDYEISDIIENGLRPLDPNFSNSRIETLFDNMLITYEFKNKLIDKGELSAKYRTNRTFFFHCISTLTDEFGLCRLFKSWGGEAMYFNNENGTALQEIGIPCIVVASINRTELNEWPSLSERMICIYLDNDYHPHDFDSWMINKNRTEVLTVIKRENKLFEQLTNIKNWRTIIN